MKVVSKHYQLHLTCSTSAWNLQCLKDAKIVRMKMETICQLNIILENATEI